MPAIESYFTNLPDPYMYWRFENNLTDSSANGFNLTDSGTTDVAGRFGRGRNFVRASSQFAYNTAGKTIPVNGCTIMGWVKLSSTTDNQCVISEGSTHATDSYRWAIFFGNVASGKWGAVLAPGGQNIGVTAADTYGADTSLTHHIALRMGASAISFFIDGKKVGTTASNGTSTTSDNRLFFGAQPAGSGTSAQRYLDAMADDWRITTSELTDWQIYQAAQGHTYGEYIPNSSTKLLMPLNGNSADVSGNGNNGIVDSNVSWVNGKYGLAASFAGADNSYISIPSASFPFGTNVFTVAMWFKMADTGYNVFLAGSNAAINDGIAIYWDGTTYLRMDKVGDGEVIYDWSGAKDTEWHRLVCTGEGAGGNKLYLDGMLRGTGSNTSNIVDPSSTIAIGNFMANNSIRTGNNLNGIVEELISENRTWSDSEVRKDYTNGKGRFGII